MIYILSNPNKDPYSKLHKYLDENGFKYKTRHLFPSEKPQFDNHENRRYHTECEEEDLLVLKIIFPNLKVSK